MYIDTNEGIKKAKSGSIIWKTFGIIAAIFLVLFFIFSGTAKIIFGILCLLNVLFIIVTFCAGFLRRGNKQENEATKARVQADVKRYQELCMNPDNKDFMTEFSSWYLQWSNGKYDAKSTSNKLMNMGLGLQLCKHNGKGVFEACIDLFHSGLSIDPNDKVSIVDAAIRLNDSMKDSERESIKAEIVSLISKYC